MLESFTGFINQLVEILRRQLNGREQLGHAGDGFFGFLVRPAVFGQGFFHGIAGGADFFEATGNLGHINAAVFTVVAAVVIIAAIVVIAAFCSGGNGIRTRLRAGFRIHVGRVDKARENIADPVRVFFGFTEGLQNGFYRTRVISQCRHDFADAFFDALGDNDFAFTGQQFHGTHFAHVHAHRIGGATNIGFHQRQSGGSFFGGCIIGSISHKQGFTIGCDLGNRNADVVDHADDVFNLVRVGDVVRQVVIYLGVSKVALLLTLGDQFFKTRLLRVR